MGRVLAGTIGVLLAFAAPASAAQVLRYDGGRVAPADDPQLPPAWETELPPPAAGESGAAERCAGVSSSASGATAVRSAIANAAKRRSISAADAASYRSAYNGARFGRARLGGSYGSELGSVIATLEGIARRGALTPSRMPALFLQLRRNTQFWTGNPSFPARPDAVREPCSAPPGRAGARIEFSGSRIVYQYYPGRGLQFQPLANFGKANGMYTACLHKRPDCDRAALRQLLDELVAIRSKRGGYTTWEYWFYFGGGTPPWTSGLSQGTAIQALSRGSKLFKEPSYLRVARSALGAFRKGPPVGVRVPSAGGSHYLIYSFAPGMRVLNGFIQSLVGLRDYTTISGDRGGAALFKAGDRAARAEVGRYDTGAWSRYSLGGAESTLSYHRLVRDFLSNLCKRTKTGVYCRTAARFTSYLKAKPKVFYSGPARVRARGASTRVPIRFSVNKVSCVTVTVRDAGGAQKYRVVLKLARGGHALLWKPPGRGVFKVSVDALDLARNRSVVERSVRVGSG
jgi:hypothetical protein